MSATLTAVEFEPGREAWLPTHNGPEPVRYIRSSDWWIVTGTDSFFTKSWCCTPQTVLYTDRASCEAHMLAYPERYGDWS